MAVCCIWLNQIDVFTVVLETANKKLAFNSDINRNDVMDSLGVRT